MLGPSVASSFCYEWRRGCVGKDPDAQGSGSEEKGFIREQAEIRVKYRQGSESRKVKSRGDPKTELARTQTRVKAGKSELRLTCKRPKLTHVETGYDRGEGSQRISTKMNKKPNRKTNNKTIQKFAGHQETETQESDKQTGIKVHETGTVGAIII